MEQIHKRFTGAQAGVLLKAYCHRVMDRPAAEQSLGIGKTRVFTLPR